MGKLFKTGRYSGFIAPLNYILDLTIVSGLSVFFLNFPSFPSLNFILYLFFSWSVSAISVQFYRVYRYSKVYHIFGLLLRQTSLFILSVLAFFGFFKLDISLNNIVGYLILSVLLVSGSKFLVYFLLRTFRLKFNGNQRLTIILGETKKALQLQDFFENNPYLGYRNQRVVNYKALDKQGIEKLFNFISAEIDEIYCSLKALNKKHIEHIVDFAETHQKVVKFIPDDNIVIHKQYNFQRYGYIPLLALKDIPLDHAINKLFKRLFDVFFSLCVIIFLLSWVTPLLALLIKLESKGPIFFKQRRKGYGYKEFTCYKFRSMRTNDQAHSIQVTKEDSRITKIGKFLRKTSMDELPQFFNVLFGSMSVVGPRPHMVSHSNMFAMSVDRFLLRHVVKPGITGLAQTSGFRGEVENEQDILGRVKFDIMYISEWSFLLDLKIIINTIINIISGDEKAY
jgi:putative colanic acid biosynthesis UDP-glucose lipid carrier transferase